MDETGFYITPQMLLNRGACRSAVDDVMDTFGVGNNDRIYLTRANVERAMSNNLNLYWLAMRVREKIGGRRDIARFDFDRIEKIERRLMDAVDNNAFYSPTTVRVGKVYNALLKLSAKAQ